MAVRRVARPFLVAALALGLTAAVAAPASGALASAPPSTGIGNDFADRYELPPGFQPEGIAIDLRGTAYLGSLANGDIFALDLRSGTGEVRSEGRGVPSAGLKVDLLGRLFVANGPSGQATVVNSRSGDVLATYQLANGPSFINDVVLTFSGAWFTDSQNAQLYKVPFKGFGLSDQSDVQTLPLTGDWVQQPGFNANGIAVTPDRRALLVVQSATGLLFRVDFATGDARQVDLGGVALTNGDGLLTVGRTLYVVQNRLNTVSEFRLAWDGRSGVLVDQITSPDFDVPTTVDNYRGSLFLPNARFGTPPTPTTDYAVIRVDR